MMYDGGGMGRPNRFRVTAVKKGTHIIYDGNEYLFMSDSFVNEYCPDEIFWGHVYNKHHECIHRECFDMAEVVVIPEDMTTMRGEKYENARNSLRNLLREDDEKSLTEIWITFIMNVFKR